MSHVESLIGSCAWRPKAAYVRPILKKTGFRISEVKNTVDALREGPKEYLALFKSIRRHIYKIYVKPHKKCWNEITHFDTLKLHALDVEGACSASSAYLAWLMSLQWDADTGHSQYARANFMQLKRNQCPVDAANVGLLWLLHFYSTWSGIERGCEECRLHRDRFSVEILSRMPPLTLGEDCILSYGARGIICGLCTSPASLKSLCARRCLRRLGRSAFINEQATWAIYHWGYEVKPNVLLRFWRGTHSKQGGLHSTVVAG
ncbi:hypothetical protein C4K18_3059 [Pseudomonas chlororaphis subsp. aurantiaca]|nr:hypothetical protein C4K18_3059 [Pseudomonas chlororaphis subsp. aurantiaca]